MDAYRLWNPDTNKCWVSRDVHFDETCFPLKKLDTFGRGQLNSAPPTVRSVGVVGSESNEALTVSHFYSYEQSPAATAPTYILDMSNPYSILEVEEFDVEDGLEDKPLPPRPSAPPAPRKAPVPLHSYTRVAPPIFPSIRAPTQQSISSRASSPDPLDILPQTEDLHPLDHVDSDSRLLYYWLRIL